MIELASSRLFAGLTKDEAAAVLTAATRRSFKASETIIRADMPATHLFVVKSGWLDYS